MTEGGFEPAELIKRADLKSDAFDHFAILSCYVRNTIRIAHGLSDRLESNQDPAGYSRRSYPVGRSVVSFYVQAPKYHNPF